MPNVSAPAAGALSPCPGAAGRCYPPEAVAPPRWRPHEWTGVSGHVYRTESPLVEFVWWGRSARQDVQDVGLLYAEGHASGWRIHGRRVGVR